MPSGIGRRTAPFHEASSGIGARDDYHPVAADWRTGLPGSQETTTLLVGGAAGSPEADLVSEGLGRGGTPPGFGYGVPSGSKVFTSGPSQSVRIRPGRMGRIPT